MNQRIEQVNQFRQSLYDVFTTSADVLMNMIDALCSNTTAQSVVELSLSPAFERGYSALFKGIANFHKAPSSQEKESKPATEKVAALTYGPQKAAEGRKGQRAPKAAEGPSASPQPAKAAEGSPASQRAPVSGPSASPQPAKAAEGPSASPQPAKAAEGPSASPQPAKAAEGSPASQRARDGTLICDTSFRYLWDVKGT